MRPGHTLPDEARHSSSTDRREKNGSPSRRIITSHQPPALFRYDSRVDRRSTSARHADAAGATMNPSMTSH